jgi:hypothetical protein
VVFDRQFIEEMNMPPMTALGWFHTVMGILAIGTAAFTLRRHQFINLTSFSGRIYLLITLVVASTALMIFNQGGFGVGHVLAIMTLAAVAVGALLERHPLMGGFRWVILLCNHWMRLLCAHSIWGF